MKDNLLRVLTFIIFPFYNIFHEYSTTYLLCIITIIGANVYYHLYKKMLHLPFLLVVCANAFSMFQWMWEFLLNLVEFLSYWFCFNDFKQRVPKEIFFKNPWSTPTFMKQNSDIQLHAVFSGACFLSKHFVLLVIWLRPNLSHYKCSFFKLIYYQIWGVWSCSGNIKQDFLMISPISYFTKRAVNK